MIRIAIFDFDGTLVDSNGIKRACMRRVASAYPGGEAALDRALVLGGDRYRLFSAVAREIYGESDREAAALAARRMIAGYSACCARGIIAAGERRGARAALEQLRRRGLRLWVASATPAAHLPELLRHRGLSRHLDGALGGPASKRDNLRKILRCERASPGEAIMIGDGMDDMMGAREVGIRFIAVHAERRISQPCRYSVPDLTTLVALIDRLRARPAQRR